MCVFFAIILFLPDFIPHKNTFAGTHIPTAATRTPFCIRQRHCAVVWVMIVACCGGVVCLYILFWDIRKPMWCTCVPRLAECVAHFVFACSRRGKCAVTLFFANLHTISSRLSLAQFVSFCHNRPASSHPNRMHFNVLFSGMKVVLSLAKTKI